MPQTRKASSSFVLVIALILGAGGSTQQTAPGGLTAEGARAIAKDAYIYGFPMATNYATMYKQAINTGNPDYRAPFNTVTSSANVATPADKFVVTPNSDTPYSLRTTATTRVNSAIFTHTTLHVWVRGAAETKAASS